MAVLSLELPKLVRPVGIVWNRQRPITPGTQILIQCLEDVARLVRSSGAVAGAQAADASAERVRAKQSLPRSILANHPATKAA